MNNRKNDYRLVIQVYEMQHGHQVIETYTVYLQLTEPEKDFFSEVFSQSDCVHSFIFGKKDSDAKGQGGSE